MRRVLLILTVVVGVFVALHRERLFLRDPLGSVERSGERVEGARVFINYLNDVLVQEGSHVYLVQGWNRLPGVPTKMTCLQGLGCMTEQNHAASLPLGGISPEKARVTMTDREVSFVDASGAPVRLKLR